MSGHRLSRLSQCLLFTALLVIALPLAGQAQIKRWVLDTEGKEIHAEEVYPHSYALLIGINHYPNVSDRNLHYAVADVTELKQELIAHYGFPAGNITTLLDEKASKQGILHAINRFTDTHKIHPDDRVLIFFSGHGQTMTLPNAESRQMGYLIPSDALIDLNDLNNLAPYNETCIKMRDVWDTLDGCPARHVLLIVDACYSGLLAAPRALKGMSPATLAAWQSQPARIVVAAGGKGEESVEDPSWGHGAFTKALLEQLRKRAADPGVVFTTTELFAEVEGEVKDLTEGKQTPQLGKHDAEGEFLFITTGKAHPSPEPVGPKPGGKVVPGSTKALLSVRTAPAGATVYVDKKPIGKTPMSLPIRLGLDDTREVMVGIVLAGYDAQKFTVTLKAGAETTIPEGGGILTLEKLSDPMPVPGPDANHDNGGGGNAEGEPKLGDVKVNEKDSAAMVYVPAGEFPMGDDDVSFIKEDNPRHTVKLSGYWIYKNLVTVQQYKAFCAATGHSMPLEPGGFKTTNKGKDYAIPKFNPGWSQGNHPIVNVSWNDAIAYCTWVGAKLPSEAQWEKAARGTDGRKYPWGDGFDISKVWASKNNYFDAGGTTSVGHYGLSVCGCSDMAGNVLEWCSDWYDKGFWSSHAADVVDPENQSIGEQKYRCLRGGSWVSFDPVIFRCAFRYLYVPSGRISYYGFRCVRQDSK